jgi:PhnB protein
MPSRLNPYLTFGGNAREAMEFYHGVFGGNLEATSYRDGGMEHQPEDADKLMHAQIEAPNGMTLMGADSPSGAPPASLSGVQISLSGDDEAELSGYYEKLAESGTVIEPLVRAPWGDQFGMLTDRYGVLWMVNISGAAQEADGRAADVA